MRDFFSSLKRGVTRAILFIAGAIFAFSLLVAGLIGALFLGLAALLSGGRIKARRFRVPPQQGQGGGGGDVVDVEVREITDAPPPPNGR